MWDENSEADKQVHSDRYPTLPKPVRVTDFESMMIGDPKMAEQIEEICSAIRMDMVPASVQQMLVDSMTPAVQRDLVYKLAGLDASILLTFKSQITLVDTVLRKVMTPEGGVNEAESKSLDISVKDAMNMSIKLTTTMSRELPKIYRIDKVQRLEQALFDVVEQCLTKDQQALVLQRLETLNMEAARKEQ